MNFEYDNNKSAANKTKHGIDFERAKSLWDDDYRVEITAKDCDEERHLIIGAINGKCWSAVITYRDKNIRIISVRRSRMEEVEIYESI